MQPFNEDEVSINKGPFMGTLTPFFTNEDALVAGLLLIKAGDISSSLWLATTLRAAMVRRIPNDEPSRLARVHDAKYLHMGVSCLHPSM